MKSRDIAMQWWNNLPFEIKFYNTIETKSLRCDDVTRHPDALTGREIEEIYAYKHSNK